jgi:hypothetical protein
MNKLIEFVCVERIWDDEKEHKLTLPYPNLEGTDLQSLIDSFISKAEGEWEEDWDWGDGLFKAYFTNLYPDRREDIEGFCYNLDNNLGNLSWAVTGYEERDDMLTLIKPYTKPKRKDGGIYLSCRRSAITYDVASNGTVTLQSHIVSESYSRYKLNFDFTWSYEGEPYEEDVRYSDGDFKSHFNLV